MVTDLIYLTWNRLEFTEASFESLLTHTGWALVRKLVIYDDGSIDGTLQYMTRAIKSVPDDVQVEFIHTNYKSPPATMNHYLQYEAKGADTFAKIDNDVVVPPGWLSVLSYVMTANPELELLGMEAGRVGLDSENSDWSWEECSHIGGVGLIRTSAFEKRGLIDPNGRFGWTEWQHTHQPVRGWVKPDLLVCCLDFMPTQPWRGLSDAYVDAGWQRRWPAYTHDFEPYWRYIRDPNR